ncbi:head-tail adaptor protein [Roseivivax isoporae]|uniref:Phage head-tail adapter protein n=1 Tax=Roseivivax isoporae LMG 25204 TaxID=1449351 RepID=X7F1D3_9RHOB|nr:head-tail adaptor protein [Roseivivax isoporae]ETX26565.1 hypothetical protein RISW2_22010 [Roseivivax isoporae LMG 25204]
MNLIERVAFDRPTETQDGYGGTETGWSEAPASYETRAQFIYQRGSEAVEAARLTGRSIYKVRIRSSVAAREITAAWRMRDLRRGTIYNIREIDTITDRQWVYVTVESGVAV